MGVFADAITVGKPDREPIPGLAVVNSNYQYVSITETMAAFHGRTVQDHIGHSVVEAVQKSVHHLLLPAYRHVITTGVAVENVIVEAFAGNRLKRCAVSYYPTQIENDPLWGVQVVAVDVTPSVSEVPLSVMQLKVLQLIGECKSNKEIADLLHISVSTVSTHRKALCQRLNLHSAVELVRYAGMLFPRHPLTRG